VAAVARAATKVLIGLPFESEQKLSLPNVQDQISVPVSSAALIAHEKKALAIGFCDSCLGLDLTRGLEIWIFVRLQKKRFRFFLDKESNDWLILSPGDGVGKVAASGELCASEFAKHLLLLNLRDLVPDQFCLHVEIVFPKGNQLAERTSNNAFGIVDGLALIGTNPYAQESASPMQFEHSLEELRGKLLNPQFQGLLTLVIGENGYDLAQKLGIPACSILKGGNWIGPLLVAAAQEGVKDLLLFGYHGKLIKIAGGIFHTHHHLADGRLEVLASLAVLEGLPLNLVKACLQAKSVEEALLTIEDFETHKALNLWNRIANAVESRSDDYLGRYGSWPMKVGSALFDRQRRLRWAGSLGTKHLSSLGVDLMN